MQDLIIYELPINERIRTLLRLEQLFFRAEHHLAGNTQWDTRASIDTLIEILHIGGRSDLKSEILKELDRQTNSLAKMENKPGVDSTRLQQVIDELSNINQQLYSLGGQVGLALKKNEFIKTIMQRSCIPGGTCDFDLPSYHYWLSQSHEIRSQTLSEWFDSFEIVKKATKLILQLIRQSAQTTEEVAISGFFQETMEINQPAQLIQVGISQAPIYAEISGGKHRFAIRFMDISLEGQIAQTQTDIPFLLTRCVI